MSHSSGPWTLEREDDRLELKGENGAKPLAHLYDSFYSEESEIEEGDLERDAKEYAANAQLIVSAPVLLQVCREYAEACQTRIEVLEEEMEELGLVAGEPDARDLEEQIEYWTATKRGVEKSIEKATSTAA
jgi:hypothetical protein